MAWILGQFDKIQTQLQAALAAAPQTPAGLEASSSTLPPAPVILPKPTEINDCVYEVHKPSRRPSVEIVFFHGLQLEGSNEAYLSTWTTRDGSELWLHWLLKDFPDARILVVSYDAHTRKTNEHGRVDMYITRENLVHDFLDAEVGQHRCPVVLVGHCVGGLVMKELCVQANTILGLNPPEKTKIGLQKLLQSVRGLFFYASPHHGSVLADSSTWFSKGPLFEHVKTLNKEAARRNEAFQKMRGKYKWRAFGLGESLPVNVGNFSDLLVTEASARHDVDDFYTVDADHFSICKPRSQKSSSYKKLSQFILSLSEEVVVNEHKCHGLPDYPIQLERRSQNIERLLMEKPVVGICGMGGIGKTTLAKTVYNKISSRFDYCCFAENVKGIQDLNDWLLRHFQRNGTRMDGSRRQWADLKGSRTLIVIDDVDSESQLSVLPKLSHFGKDSLIILTSRGQGIFKFYDYCGIYDVEFLRKDEAFKLFCQHAFGMEEIPSHAAEWNHLKKNVEAVVSKCDGLPLTLEVIGRYLRNEVDPKVWEATLVKLTKADSIDGEKNDRVWASLRVSYDSLAKDEQQMFIEAGTYFVGQKLERALAVWSSTSQSTLARWNNLVSRSLVKEGADKTVWVHEQLRDLSKTIAEGYTVRVWDVDANELVHQKYLSEVNPTTRILRLAPFNPHSKLEIRRIDEFKELKYVDFDDVGYEGRAKVLSTTLLLLRYVQRHLSESEFPMSLTNARNLVILELENFHVPKEFHGGLGNLTKLCYLSLARMRGLDRLPEAFGNLSFLKHVILRDLRLPRLPASLGNLAALEYLELEKLDIVELPESFGKLCSLVSLRIYSCKQLAKLPGTFGGEMSSLKLLEIQRCPLLECLPDSFCELSRLQQLDLRYCEGLKELPDSFGNLSALEGLILEGTGIERLPDSVSMLSSLLRLNLGSSLRLKDLADSVWNLSAVEYLDLRATGIERLPTSLGRLSALEELHCEFHQARQLPNDFCRLTSLRALSVDSCSLESLPEGFGELSKLEKLKLFVDGLVALPVDFGQLSSLQTLHLRSRKLEKLPDSFGKLVSLQELTIELKNPGRLLTLIGGMSSLRILRVYEIEKISEDNLVAHDTGGMLPDDIFGKLRSLEELEIREGSLECLPTSLGGLSSLQTLTVDCPNLRKLPCNLGNLGSLERFEIDASKLETLPDSIGQLRSLSRMSFIVPKMERLPESIQQLSSLAEFWFDCDGHERLPDNFGHLPFASLRLRLHGQGALPKGLGRLSSLKRLRLEFMNARTLPEELGNLSSLRELEIGCEKLKSLPDSLARLCCLEELSLTNCNSLKSLPKNLGRRSLYQPATGHGERRNDERCAIQTTAVGADTAELTVSVSVCDYLDDSRMSRLGWSRDGSIWIHSYRRKRPDSRNVAVDRILWSTRALCYMFVSLFILRKVSSALRST